MKARADFPYYNGQPVQIDAAGWLAILGSVALAFTALTAIPLRTFPLNLVPALLFLVIPLVALRLVTGQHWSALFGKVGVKEVGMAIGFAVLTLACSLVSAILLEHLFDFSQNPVSETMRAMTGWQFAAILAVTVPQLVGEELLGILPFLAVLWLCVTRLGMRRRLGIVIALLVSSLIFGAAHLPTYNWNWIQSLVVIGSARVILTLAYIATRNLWVSAGAHIINDWAGFIAVFALGHAPLATQ